MTGSSGWNRCIAIRGNTIALNGRRYAILSMRHLLPGLVVLLTLEFMPRHRQLPPPGREMALPLRGAHRIQKGHPDPTLRSIP